MHRLYEAADRIEAQRLIDLLRDNHIPAVVLGDYLSGAAGELPATIFPTVWLVEDRHRVPAERLLREFIEFIPQGTGAAWRCPGCGETVEAGFELCWNCGTGHPGE